MPDRIVRAAILSSESVNSLSWQAEVFYRRLMSVADDFGRYDGRESIIRCQLYPLQIDKVSDSDVVKLVRECANAGLVRQYTVDAKPYVEILKFDQRLRAKKSKFPSPDGDCCQPPADDGKCIGRESESETKRNEVNGALPTLEECEAMAEKLGMPKAEGDAFFRNYNGVGWITKHGQPILNWVDFMHKWKSTYEHGIRNTFIKNQNGMPVVVGGVKPMAHKWQADKAIENAQADIKRIQNDSSKKVARKDQYDIVRDFLTDDAKSEIADLKTEIERLRNLKKGLL